MIMVKKGIVTIVLALTVMAVAAWTAVFLATPGHPANAVFEISPGESAAQIAARLRSAGFVHSAALFRRVLAATGRSQALQPGRHDLSNIETLSDLAERLTEGGVSADEFVLLLREGEDLRGLHDALKKAGYAAADDLFGVTGEPAAGCDATRQAPDLTADFSFLAGRPKCASMEGYLFPDTYRLPRAATPDKIIWRLLANFARKTGDAEVEAKAAASGHSLHEVLTMASILEKEVRSDYDRRAVADIFWRRIKAGMPLQADSTVNYVTGGAKPSVSLAETALDSPYNTYAHRGLPPGPIGNPGLATIMAALNPLPNDDWFFLTDPNGGVHYAKTFAEHVANKKKFLR